MKHLIVGTAGHIDHGKSTLIKALTSIDPDRLEEEKKRGITIVLGYAYLKNNEDLISFIDVPGHEKFVKTMLAGSTGIDELMLIVAADEGVMPQTLEHFTIAKHLDLKRGFVVITKTDRVSSDQIEKVFNQVKQLTLGTFLENAPIFKTSVNESDSYERIKDYLFTQLIENDVDRETKASRLYIDRVFSLKGKGTIVTGTLIEGILNKNETIYLYPSGKSARIRQLQIHGTEVDQAIYGNRVAVNLSIDKEDLERGELMTSMNGRPGQYIIDVKLDVDSEIHHWERIRFYHGTSEIMGRIAIKDQKSLHEKDSLEVQLRLETPIFANVGDRYILRRFSPVETIGGGEILNTQGHKFHSRSNENEVLDPLNILKVIINISEPFVLKIPELSQYSLSETALKVYFEKLVKHRLVVNFDQNYFMHMETYQKQEANAFDYISNFHEKFPYKLGINKAELKSKCFVNYSKANYDRFIQKLTEDKILKLKGVVLSLFDFDIIRDTNFLKIYDQFERCFEGEEGIVCNYKTLKLIAEKSQNHSDVLTYLNSNEIIVKISEEHYILGSELNKAKAVLLETLNDRGQISVAEFRDVFETSRKISVMLLEYFDVVGFTKRIDNIRVLNK